MKAMKLTMISVFIQMILFATINSAIIKGHKTSGSRNLGNVKLSSQNLSEKHIPSRYLKLKNFITKYSKKAGVKLGSGDAKRKLFSKYYLLALFI